VDVQVPEVPEHRAPLTIRNLFHHHDAHPVVLDFALARVFGDQWVEWEAITIWESVKDAFKTDISELSKAKVQTIKTLHLVDAPWTQWQVFEKVVQGLNNNLPRFDLMQAPSLPQLYAAVDMMTTHWPNGEEPWSDEVKRYIAASVIHEHVCYVTPPLDFVQMEISQPQYECQNCGNVDSALFHDGVCDTCAMKFHPEKNNLDFLPHPDVVEKTPGRNIKVILKYNPDEVQARYNAAKSGQSLPLQENAVDMQVDRLLAAESYMNQRRREMVEQLTALKSWLGTS
jgi:hypothetical protein